MLFETVLSEMEAKNIPLRLLAHLGDAVFELIERERETLSAKTAIKLHARVVGRVNAHSQAEILDALTPFLTLAEADIVRRARNLKIKGRRKVDQSIYRQATALEALIGFLFLTDKARLHELMKHSR